uniref:Uncharacterized protein n=1 Tax=Arundo donax TaxID=35708 RepID=A0A0A9CGR1_ARUDO
MVNHIESIGYECSTNQKKLLPSVLNLVWPNYFSFLSCLSSNIP